MPSLKVVPAQQPSALARLVEDYLAACRARGLSPKTVDGAYGYPLRSILLPFCRDAGITEISGLDNRALDRLSGRLLERGGAKGALSKASVHAYMRAVNHLLAWAKKEGEGIGAKAQLPRLPKRLLEVLSRAELDRMEDAATTERDKLIVRTLADTGIRVGELVGLRTSDLHERNRSLFLRVRGKGAKERMVPVPPPLYRRLRRYADRGRPKDVRSDRLFMGLRRRPGSDHAPLTESGAQQMVRTLAKVAGIERRVYPHLLRHSYATWALNHGMNPILLAQVLGHSSLTMIQQVYAHQTPEDAYQAMLKALVEDRS